ncbi:Histone acetyltransferase type B catalytic like protein [Argiope bruennichi]|uniref:Histone acetyltransferase type B catalytic like protein n=1 Tax=Argiope bruennichi TaxID=94029 RepID=A0A8T0E7A6_ARGBR|nr:Histone acetyltransferase type B catalytic like protein [Argiope bruennichi]
MQTLILWFIDAASYIDESDERWDYFVLHQHITDGDTKLFPFAGYATVYRYYAYPLNIRPRISQMLVLPPYQKCGLGTKLLENICDWYVKDPEVLDVTVEDPSEEFVRIRDFIDCKRCEPLPSFSKENLFKDEYRAYRLDVKNRLNIPFQREKLDLEKLQKNLTPDELKAAANPIPREQRIEQLDHMYTELEEKYRYVLDRLKEECIHLFMAACGHLHILLRLVVEIWCRRSHQTIRGNLERSQKDLYRDQYVAGEVDGLHGRVDLAPTENNVVITEKIRRFLDEISRSVYPVKTTDLFNVKPPLCQAYTCPHKVLKRTQKSFTMELNGRTSTTSTDRVKPARLIPTCEEQTPILHAEKTASPANFRSDEQQSDDQTDKPDKTVTSSFLIEAITY